KLRGNALEDLAFTDALTGLGNRRAWERWLDAARDAARHDGEPLCVAIFDLDHFKAYNDANGHPAGDALLAGAALMWRRELRPTDILARYGGEEFAAALPACTLEGARSSSSAFAPRRPPARRCRPASRNGTEPRTTRRSSRAPTQRSTRPRPPGATARSWRPRRPRAGSPTQRAVPCPHGP